VTLDEYTAPECQLRDCDADAETTREHAEYSEVQVCRTCAGLFDERGGEADA
jgi:hypothetical protein